MLERAELVNSKHLTTIISTPTRGEEILYTNTEKKWNRKINNVPWKCKHQKHKQKYLLLYTFNLFHVKSREDHFSKYNVDCVASENYDGGYVWYPGMCF